MTQIIGVICENGKKAIALCDRMLTTADLSLAFEHETPKIEGLTSNCVALTAGSALIHEPIFREVKKRFREQPKPSITRIVDSLVEEYQKLRFKRLEQSIFRRYGLTIQEFYNIQGRLHDGVVMRLTEEMRKYTLDLHILVVGVDSEGAHLYHIHNPGIAEPFNALGFCCIGTGQRHADTTFAYRRYSPSLPLKKALLIAYEAKKKAEMAGGVGKMTDIVILDENGWHFLSEDSKDMLEKVYNSIEERTTYLKEVEAELEKLRLE